MLKERWITLLLPPLDRVPSIRLVFSVSCGYMSEIQVPPVISLAASQLGKLGGVALKEKIGKDGMSVRGRSGAKKRWGKRKDSRR